MPIYEYQCESCEKRTEAIQKLDEPPLTICPHCGGPLRKLMSAPSFQSDQLRAQGQRLVRDGLRRQVGR